MSKASVTKHNYKDLFSHYPDLIAQMKNKFTNHQFILNLAQQQQRLYVEALYCHRCNLPFLYVHQAIAVHLNSNKYQHLIQGIGSTSDSKDIFGKSQSCKVWKKR